MTRTRPRPLDATEIDRQLARLPGVARGAATTLVVAVRAASFEDAVRLVDVVGQDAAAMDHHPEIRLRLRVVTFTLTTHWERAITQLDVDLAARILRAARSAGAEVLPAPERVEIAIDCADADAVRPFWAAGLGYAERLADDDGGVELHDPGGHGPVLWFQRMEPPRAGRGRIHLDVYVPDDVAPGRVQACLAAGGVLVSDAHAPSWWVLADPEGNELCVCTRPEGADPARQTT
ncbi:MAG TPA: VOC family protein [Kineosporiaceae bacterium]|nr:VOC family protein [Kineosporiaceae bacterium]